MKIIVDRIEGDYLVVELPNGKYKNINKNRYPDAKEGDIIDTEINKIIDNSNRKKIIQDKFNKLLNK